MIADFSHGMAPKGKATASGGFAMGGVFFLWTLNNYLLPQPMPGEVGASLVAFLTWLASYFFEN